MSMRIIGLGVVVLTTLVLCTTVAFADVSSTDKNEIQDQIDSIVSSANRGDVDAILTIISPNAKPTLGSEIEESIAGKSISFEQSITSYEDLGDNRVRVNGRYAAQGTGWSVSGLSNFFAFERHEDSWLLFDTNFHQKLGLGYVGRKVTTIAVLTIVSLVVFLVLGTAWQRRSQQYAALEDLHEHLRLHDIDASILTEDSPEALQQDEGTLQRLTRHVFGGDPGYIAVRGMHYDLVTVRIAVVERTRSTSFTFNSVPVYEQGTSWTPIEYHYIVRTGIADGEALKAKLKKKAAGSASISHVEWRGSGLADLLNSQEELNMAIKSTLMPQDDLKVVYYRKNRVARIILTMRKEKRQRSVLGFSPGFSHSEADRSLPLPGTEKMSVINQIAGLVRQGTSGSSPL